MRKGSIVALAALALAGLLGPGARAELFSKKYVFKTGVKLEIGAEIAGGIRIDSITFQAPPTEDGKIQRSGGSLKAEIAVSNVGQKSQSVGIAIALIDEDNRLVAAGSGGTKLLPLRAGRQMSYAIVFDDVNTEALAASVFLLAVEPKP